MNVNAEMRNAAGRPSTTYRAMSERRVTRATERFRAERMSVELQRAARAGLTGKAAQERAKRTVDRQAERYKSAIQLAHNRRWIQAAVNSAKAGSRNGVFDVRHNPSNARMSLRELMAFGRGRLSSSQYLQMERRVVQWGERADPRASNRTWKPKAGDGNGRDQ